MDLVWKALSDPTRRDILDLLRDGPKTTGDVCRPFQQSRFAIMKHLTVLEEAGLIVVQRRGRERWNYLNSIPIQMIHDRWMTPYATLWASSLLDLKHSVERKRAKRKAS